MSAFFKASCKGYNTGVKFGEVVRGLLQIVRRFRVTIDANYMVIITNALCLDGMAGSLLPSFSVLDAAQPLLQAHKWLPPWLFRASLPLMHVLKGVQESIMLSAEENDADYSRPRTASHGPGGPLRRSV